MALLATHFRIMRFTSSLRGLAAGWTNRPAILLEALLAPVAFEDGVTDDASDETEIQMNLLVLVTLLLTSSSLYLPCWLARVNKLMGDDPFTFLALLFITGALFASFLLPKYYRRAEGFQKREARWLFEIMLFLPGINFILGPIIIQYELNRYAYLKSRAA
jgi:heme/copper-type cytochrome/quinol oxidase subunit 3